MWSMLNGWSEKKKTEFLWWPRAEADCTIKIATLCKTIDIDNREKKLFILTFTYFYVNLNKTYE